MATLSSLTRPLDPVDSRAGQLIQNKVDKVDKVCVRLRQWSGGLSDQAGHVASLLVEIASGTGLQVNVFREVEAAFSRINETTELTRVEAAGAPGREVPRLEQGLAREPGKRG